MIVRMMRIRDAVVAYQATDLARNHRQVIDAARHGGALIRDKDGTTLVMGSAEAAGRTADIADLAMDLVRAARVLLNSEREHGPEEYGDLAWLAALPDEAQRRFFDEMGDALMVAASGTSLRPVELLLGDWRATAEAWADPGTRQRLVASEDAPLGNVTL